MHEKITYEELIQARRRSMAEAGSVEKTIRNAISYLHRYLMAPTGRSDVDLVGAELREDFDSSLDQALTAAGSNKRAVRAALKQWKSTYEDLLQSQGLPDDFSEALQELFRRHNLVGENHFQAVKVAQLAGINDTTLRHWVRGSRTPSPKSRKDIRRLEVFFKLPAGTLSDLLSSYGISAPEKSERARGINTPYRLKKDEIPPSLEEEIQDLVRFKTAPAPPRGMKRNEAWKTKPLNEHGGYAYPIAVISKDRYSPTAETILQSTCNYLGYLHREQEVSLDDVSLALFAKTEWVSDFLDFLAQRAGRHTTNLVRFLNHIVTPLLHPEAGFVAQRADLAALHPDGIPQSGWKDFCAREREEMLRLSKDLERGNTLEFGRDPEENIESILRADDPIAWLVELERRVSASGPSPTTAPIRYAAWIRDRLLIRLLISNPLRKNQIQTLTWRSDNTGELRQDHDGQWWLVFEVRRFKNDRFAAKRKYQAPVDGWVAELIPQYLEAARPRLYGAGECDYLFLPCKKTNGSRLGFSSLDIRLAGITKKFLPDVAPRGFRTHAFRHIIATGMLKNGYTVDEVAAVLHDRPNTIRKAYSHLVESDGAKALSGHLAKLRGEGPGHGRRAA